jgi:hypothetical protein
MYEYLRVRNNPQDNIVYRCVFAGVFLWVSIDSVFGGGLGGIQKVQTRLCLGDTMNYKVAQISVWTEPVIGGASRAKFGTSANNLPPLLV